MEPASRVVGQTPAVHAAVKRHYYERLPGSRIISPGVVAAPLGAAAVAALEFLRTAKVLPRAEREEVHPSDDRHDFVVQITHAAVGALVVVTLVVWLVARVFGRRT